MTGGSGGGSWREEEVVREARWRGGGRERLVEIISPPLRYLDRVHLEPRAATFRAVTCLLRRPQHEATGKPSLLTWLRRNHCVASLFRSQNDSPLRTLFSFQIG